MKLKNRFKFFVLVSCLLGSIVSFASAASASASASAAARRSALSDADLAEQIISFQKKGQEIPEAYRQHLSRLEGQKGGKVFLIKNKDGSYSLASEQQEPQGSTVDDEAALAALAAEKGHQFDITPAGGLSFDDSAAANGSKYNGDGSVRMGIFENPEAQAMLRAFREGDQPSQEEVQAMFQKLMPKQGER